MAADETLPHSPERRIIAGRGTDEDTWEETPQLRDLATCDVAEWAGTYRHIWLVAPHPDDEILALGGSLAALAASSAALHIVSVTDGEASHHESSAWTPERLAAHRPNELRRGLDVLGVDAEIVRVGLPDGRVGAHRDVLLKALVARVDEHDLILVTCRFDGHPDHEACGDVAVLAGELTGARVFEYPVWMWHWASPGDRVIPWHRARRLPLDATLIRKKAEAIREFASQVEPDDGREPVLPAHVLPRFLRPFEVVFT